MNKILIKTLALFLIVGITSCSYQPIFLEKDYNFEIKESFYNGERDINRIIRNKLKFIKNTENKDKKKYVISVNSKKERKIVSKDSKGDPLKFEMNIIVEYRIISNDKLLLTNKIEKNNIYNNDSDQFKLEQTEDIIVENLTGSISDNIISSITNLNDN